MSKHKKKRSKKSNRKLTKLKKPVEKFDPNEIEKYIVLNLNYRLDYSSTVTRLLTIKINVKASTNAALMNILEMVRKFEQKNGEYTFFNINNIDEKLKLAFIPEELKMSSNLTISTIAEYFEKIKILNDIKLEFTGFLNPVDITETSQSKNNDEPNEREKESEKDIAFLENREKNKKEDDNETKQRIKSLISSFAEETLQSVQHAILDNLHAKLSKYGKINYLTMAVKNKKMRITAQNITYRIPKSLSLDEYELKMAMINTFQEKLLIKLKDYLFLLTLFNDDDLFFDLKITNFKIKMDENIFSEFKSKDEKQTIKQNIKTTLNDLIENENAILKYLDIQNDLHEILTT